VETVGVETLGSRQVYANPWMTVREDSIRRSDGSTAIYGVVDSPDIALVIPVDGDRLQLIEQWTCGRPGSPVPTSSG